MANQNFCLKWEGFQSNVTSLFNDLRQEDELVDITLCSEGQRIGAHRMMLSACSPYFRDVLKNNPCQHMVFYMKDTSAYNLRALVEFMYKGSVNVAQSQLASFIKTAESLQIRGLSGEDDKAPPSLPPPPPPPPTLPVQRRPPAAVAQEFPTFHRRSAPAAQEHRLPPPSLPVPSPPAKRRRNVSSEFMAAVPISASAPPVISTPSDNEQNNVTSAASAIDSSDATASPWEASAPEPPSPTSGASNQSAMSPHPPPRPASTHPHEDYETPTMAEHSPLKTENVKVEKIDLTEDDDEDDGSLEATLGQVAEYEGFDDSNQGMMGSEFQDQMMTGEYGGEMGAGPSHMMTGEDGNSQGVDQAQRCDICNDMFSNSNTLQMHKKKHEGKTTCPVCGGVYSMVHNLRVHMRAKHGMNAEQVSRYVPTRRRFITNRTLVNVRPPADPRSRTNQPAAPRSHPSSYGPPHC